MPRQGDQGVHSRMDGVSAGAAAAAPVRGVSPGKVASYPGAAGAGSTTGGAQVEAVAGCRICEVRWRPS